MSILFAAAFMNQASQDQGLEQGAGLFVVSCPVAGAGFYAADSADSSMPSPMLFFTDPEKVPPNCRSI